MDNITDITFNFELYEDILVELNKKFNESIDEVYSQLALYETIKPCEDLNHMGEPFKNYYDQLVGDDGEEYDKAFNKLNNTIKNDLYKALMVVKQLSENYIKTVDFLIGLYSARIEYLTAGKTQDQIYSNYKLRLEWQDIKRKQDKYRKLKDINIEKTKEVLELKDKLSEEPEK